MLMLPRSDAIDPYFIYFILIYCDMYEQMLLSQFYSILSNGSCHNILKWQRSSPSAFRQSSAQYNTKAQDLLKDVKTYKEISSDPTNKLKNKLINLIKKIKTDGGISEQLYKKMYPTWAVAPMFYGLPQVHKRDIPLRPIVSSRGSLN